MSIMPLPHRRWLANPKATEDLARELASIVTPRQTIILHGPLGAGKTCLAKALITALGGGDEVTSPTFTLIQSYDTRLGIVHHFDLYRVCHPDELDEIGWDDALAEGICLIEWPEKAGWRLPSQSLNCVLMMADQGRQIDISVGNPVHALTSIPPLEG